MAWERFPGHARLYCAVSLILGLSARPLRADEPAFDSDTIDGLIPRAIGPAATSGRIAAVDAIEQKGKLTVWVGAASGGVWKSQDGATTWKPLFDKYTQSIGAVTIDRQHPDTVWVGTGETWVRNSVSIGSGVYRTSDGGDSWQALGLADSERIARIAIDPRNSARVFVCATGRLWSGHPERGVFRTTDGGKSWQKVLYVDDSTGCADLAMDPRDPNVLVASMWHLRRTAWSFTSGGATGGLYRSTDGGSTWQPIKKGLPTGPLGRISIAFARSRPGLVYAHVESARTALHASEDGGQSWREINSGPSLAIRPFYFGRLVVDPTDEKLIYKPSVFLSVSEDGGKSFSPRTGSFHGDLHDIWVNPTRPAEVLIATDGGLYISSDRATHFRFVGGLPVAQLYHVSADLDVPYNVYGGLQDNGSWMAPSRRSGGIGNRHWQSIGIGDGFWAFPDLHDRDIVYTEWQGGNLTRVSRATLEAKDIKPSERPGEAKYRFNWNAPVHLSASRPGVLYLGAQYLLRSKDRGESWQRISPDLTTNDPQKQKQEESGGLSIDNSSAENHCTIYSIAESPRDPNVVWVGTDDGNLQVTRDGGKSWKNVVGAVPGLPPHTWVSHVEASRFAPGTAYATFDGHTRGDLKPYLFRTTDFGASWRPLATADVEGYAHVLREDRESSQLLFLGTELGLFLSLDGGAHWAAFKGGGDFPRVAVRDLFIHPREGDLIIATHGRGIYILDDLTPLRRITAELLGKSLAIIDSRASELELPATEQEFGGDDEWTGQTVPEAATITYYLKKRHIFGDLKVEILNAKGVRVAELSGGKRRGLNRVLWPMRMPPPRMPPAATEVMQQYAMLGPRVPAGTYTVRINRAGETITGQLRIVNDPRSHYTVQDRALQQKTVLKLYAMLEDLSGLVDHIAELSRQPAAKGLAGELEALRLKLAASREVGMLSGEEQLRERLGMLYGSVNGFDGRPTQSQLKRMEMLGTELAQAHAQLESLKQRISAAR
jgi:photosystem II stability/assembly factor-like uncharacterized protein